MPGFLELAKKTDTGKIKRLLLLCLVFACFAVPAADRYFMLTEEEIAADHARYSLYVSQEDALAAGALRDPSYMAILAADR